MPASPMAGVDRHHAGVEPCALPMPAPVMPAPSHAGVAHAGAHADVAHAGIGRCRRRRQAPACAVSRAKIPPRFSGGGGRRGLGHRLGIDPRQLGGKIGLDRRLAWNVGGSGAVLAAMPRESAACPHIGQPRCGGGGASAAASAAASGRRRWRRRRTGQRSARGRDRKRLPDMARIWSNGPSAPQAESTALVS